MHKLGKQPYAFGNWEGLFYYVSGLGDILIMFRMGGSLYIAYSYLGVEKLFNSYSDPGMLLELRWFCDWFLS